MKEIDPVQPVSASGSVKVRDHNYRKVIHNRNLVSCRVLIKETDILVNSSDYLDKQARDLVHNYRRQIEGYINKRPDFITSLLPYPEDPFAPPIIKDMILAGKRFETGPMAAVAGAIAQYVGNDLLKYSPEVIVENGGDIFIKTERPVTVSLYSGSSQLSGMIGMVIQGGEPVGVCTSSSTVGHSLSLGNVDAVCIVAENACIADAAATSLGNRIKNVSSIKREIEHFKQSEDITGGIVVMKNTMATWGNIELTTLKGIRKNGKAR